MTIEVQSIPKIDYLLVIMKGPWSEQGIKHSLDCIKAEADLQGMKKILLDMLDISAPESEMIRYATGEYVARIMPKPYKIAAFSHREKINHFGETVAVNRGAWVQIFYDHDSALEWLLHD